MDATLWIDTLARRLTDIEFKYANLPESIAPVQAGGDVHFRELANGIVIVDRWWLRIPAPLATLRATVVTDSGAPAVGRALMLANTSHVAKVDSTGRAVISRLVPRRYVGLIRDSRLDSIEVGLTTRFTFSATDSSTISGRTTAPSPAAYVAARCKMSSLTPTEPGDFLLIGRVYGSDGKPVHSTIWPMSRRDADSVDKWSGVTGSDGIFDFCGSQFRLGDVLTISAGHSKEDIHIVREFPLTDRLAVIRVVVPTPH